MTNKKALLFSVLICKQGKDAGLILYASDFLRSPVRDVGWASTTSVSLQFFLADNGPLMGQEIARETLSIKHFLHSNAFLCNLWLKHLYLCEVKYSIKKYSKKYGIAHPFPLPRTGPVFRL